VQVLDVQSKSVQVLDEDFRSRKESIYNGVDLWTESLWGFRCIARRRFSRRTRDCPHK